MELDLSSQSVLNITTYPDLDDNKFVDCAVAIGADYLVTNDRDYLPLKKIGFPKVTILKIDEFMEVLKAL